MQVGVRVQVREQAGASAGKCESGGSSLHTWSAMQCRPRARRRFRITAPAVTLMPVAFLRIILLWPTLTCESGYRCCRTWIKSSATHSASSAIYR